MCFYLVFLSALRQRTSQRLMFHLCTEDRDALKSPQVIHHDCRHQLKSFFSTLYALYYVLHRI